MCKHIANVQCIFQASCCRKWFECSECHFEVCKSPLIMSSPIALLCKKCCEPFQMNFLLLDKEDEDCPHCGNHLVIQAISPDITVTTTSNL